MAAFSANDDSPPPLINGGGDCGEEELEDDEFDYELGRFHVQGFLYVFRF